MNSLILDDNNNISFFKFKVNNNIFIFNCYTFKESYK